MTEKNQIPCEECPATGYRARINDKDVGHPCVRDGICWRDPEQIATYDKRARSAREALFAWPFGGSGTILTERKNIRRT